MWGSGQWTKHSPGHEAAESTKSSARGRDHRRALECSAAARQHGRRLPASDRPGCRHDCAGPARRSPLPESWRSKDLEMLPEAIGSGSPVEDIFRQSRTSGNLVGSCGSWETGLLHREKRVPTHWSTSNCGSGGGSAIGTKRSAPKKPATSAPASSATRTPAASASSPPPRLPIRERTAAQEKGPLPMIRSSRSSPSNGTVLRSSSASFDAPAQRGPQVQGSGTSLEATG